MDTVNAHGVPPIPVPQGRRLSTEHFPGVCDAAGNVPSSVVPPRGPPGRASARRNPLNDPPQRADMNRMASGNPWADLPRLIQRHGQSRDECVTDEDDAECLEVGDDWNVVGESADIDRSDEASSETPLVSGGIRREPVVCNTCGRIFATVNGMQVHARATRTAEFYANKLAGLRASNRDGLKRRKGLWLKRRPNLLFVAPWEVSMRTFIGCFPDVPRKPSNPTGEGPCTNSMYNNTVKFFGWVGPRIQQRTQTLPLMLRKAMILGFGKFWRKRNMTSHGHLG